MQTLFDVAKTTAALTFFPLSFSALLSLTVAPLLCGTPEIRRA